MDDSNAIAPEQLVQRHAQPGRSLLAVLHAIQDELGFVPPATVAPLARAMNLSRAEVHGVLTYYHHFRTAARRAGHRATVPRRSLPQHGHRGAGAAHRSAHRLPLRRRASSAHGATVELESVYCLGQCALSPAMMINGTLHAKVTPQKFDALLAAATKRVEETA